ncbi:MAG: deoxynucleoside kinase [Anaerolineales bacterium]
MKWFVAVAGNIGVGKSTLVQLLAGRLDWTPFLEAEVQNPYLADFYRDMPTWSFQSQIFFLSRRLRAHREIADHPGSGIQDRSVYEDAEVFARNLYLEGHITERDHRTYRELYEVLTKLLPPPDLVVFLRASVDTLLERISHRGREYERRIEPEYLSQLNQLYEDWVEQFTLCPILSVPADNLNYVLHGAHLDLIVSKIRDKLSGKEEVRFEAEEVAKLN